MPAAAKHRAASPTVPAEPDPPVLTAVPPQPEPLTDEEHDIPLPSPGFVRALAVRGYEAIEGSRTIGQLGPLVSVGLARELASLRALRQERRAVYQDQRRTSPRAAGVRICRIREDTAEASAVLHVGRQVRAVALRLEWAHQHWRAVELTIL